MAVPVAFYHCCARILAIFCVAYAAAEICCRLYPVTEFEAAMFHLSCGASAFVTVAYSVACDVPQGRVGERVNVVRRTVGGVHVTVRTLACPPVARVALRAGRAAPPA
jgi:hypothetical protein